MHIPLHHIQFAIALFISQVLCPNIEVGMGSANQRPTWHVSPRVAVDTFFFSRSFIGIDITSITQAYL